MKRIYHHHHHLTKCGNHYKESSCIRGRMQTLQKSWQKLRKHRTMPIVWGPLCLWQCFSFVDASGLWKEYIIIIIIWQNAETTIRSRCIEGRMQKLQDPATFEKCHPHHDNFVLRNIPFWEIYLPYGVCKLRVSNRRTAQCTMCLPTIAGLHGFD